MRNTLMLATILLAFGTTHAQAQSNSLGDQITAVAYCSTETAAKVLARAVTLNGNKGYQRVMADMRVACFDARVHRGLPAPKVTLTEKLFSVRRPDGDSFQFWKAIDGQGTVGFTWTHIDDGSSGA